MIFACTIANRADILTFLKSRKMNEEVRMVQNGQLFIGEDYSELLREILVLSNANKQPLPFANLDGQPVTFVRAAKRDNRIITRCHFRRKGDHASTPTDRTPIAHRRVQVALANIGLWLGQQATLEHRVDVHRKAPESFHRCDVLWEPSSIAWEVDLSLRHKEDQALRDNVRHDSGLTMISIVDGKVSPYYLDELPRVKIRGLEDLSKRQKAQFSTCYVNNVERWNAESNTWEWWPSFKFGRLCEGLVKNEWAYTRIKHRWRWVLLADIRAATHMTEEHQLDDSSITAPPPIPGPIPGPKPSP